ncbi:MAG TPA: YciI family protein, partial [Gemmatimonadaceae bacterium]|nr:YciI family protein [Gemmatimonadaceae bacterium]
MKYLCLIHWNEHELETLPAAELHALEAAHLDLNDELRRSGKLVEAEALELSRSATLVRVRRERVSVVDGPFAESKEVVAGFYLLEVRDREEAVAIAARLPSATRATIEIRPVHPL